MIRCRIFTLAAGVIAATAGSAMAICADLDRLTQTDADLSLQGVSCSRSLGLSGARAVNCAWPFAYRSAAAQAKFNDMWDAIGQCAGVTAISRNAPGVNHPDSYDLQLFTTEFGEIGLSLKDKGALQETYVFLRVSTAPAD